MVLLAAISMLVARQVVVPIRSASRIAVRFADGRLKERMPVRGEDDIARLAMSFNEMAESLSKQITQLEEFGNLQRQFTSDVSHELRTPLTTIRLAGDMLYDSRHAFEPSVGRSAELLHTQVERFETLLADLLEISRYDAQAVQLDTAPVVPASLAADIVDEFRPLAERAGVELQLATPGGHTTMRLDAKRVRRILRNLVLPPEVAVLVGDAVDVRALAGGQDAEATVRRVADELMARLIDLVEELRASTAPYPQGVPRTDP